MPQKLGQHFLIDKKAASKIISALEFPPKADQPRAEKFSEVIVEIGPGQGALTLPLAKICEEIGCKIVAIERDAYLANRLIGESADWNRVLTIELGDVLKILPVLASRLSALTSWKLVGNIPYYITGRLLRVLSELANKPGLIVLTVQKEVAERIIGEPPRMNLLAAITRFWAEPRIIGYLKPKSFAPAPKVESAIIKLKVRNQTSPPKADPRLCPALNGQSPLAEKVGNNEYYKFIRIFFKQPRKTILNNLRAGFELPAEAIRKLLSRHGLTGAERPQNIDLKLLEALASEFRKL